MPMPFGGLATTDNYATGVVPKINDADKGVACWLDPAYVTYSGTPWTGSKRYASGTFQWFNGSAWADLPLPYASLASPALTGTPTAPTAAADTNSAQLATTAWYAGQRGTAAPQANGTASAGASYRFASQDHVHPTDGSRAPLASPTFSGTPTAPTQSAGNNSTLLATTAFVQGAVATRLPLSGGQLTGLLEVASAEGLRVTNGAAFVCGFNSAGSVRTGYLQWAAGAAVRLAAEGGLPVVVLTSGQQRLLVSDSVVEASRAARSVPVSMAYGSALTVNAQGSNVFLVGTLTGNVNSLAITNAVEGQFITLRFTQDGTGGRTIALPGGAAVSGKPSLVGGKTSYLNITLNATAGRFEGAWLAIP